MTRLRLAQVAPPVATPHEGAVVVPVQLAAALARRGHSVELWQLHDWPAAEFAGLVGLLDEAGVTRLPLRPAGRMRLGAAGRRARDRAVDLVHLHSVFVPANTALARLGIPYAVSPHGGYPPAALARSRLRKQVYLAAFERRMLRGAALVCALSPAEAADVQRAAGRRLPVEVIPNAVAPVPDVGGGTGTRAALDIPPGRRMAVFAGRLDVRHKGLDRAVHALAAVRDWQLVLVGPDHRGGAAALRALAEQLGVTDRLALVGPRSGGALHELLAAADLFVLASRWEGQPLALLEALAHGTPALVSRPVDDAVGVEAAGAGWVFDRDLAAVWRDASAQQAAVWEQRSQAARALAAGRDWDQVAARYEEAYRAALARAG